VESRADAHTERMKAKVCLVGESAVGKTSMVRRFVLDEFDDRYVTTLGAKVSKKEIFVERPDRTRVHIDVTVWDIMGERGFRDLLKDAYFQGARGILAVCDLTRPSTLNGLDDWVTSVFKVVGEIPVVYAVNKHDLRDEVLILFGEKEIQEHARAFDAPWLHTSAKTGENVESAFRALGEKIARAPAG
jgi:small GTP-binding protein